MELSSLSFSNNEWIPERYAFGKVDSQLHVALADNFNPQFSWGDVPPGTQSFALICHDPDVPSHAELINQENQSVPASLPRVNFFHWVLVNLPADLREIEEGAFPNGITPCGKGGPLAPFGAKQGINDYTAWFAQDHDMSGDYFGYDGPCPPWNDELAHRYIFTLYALSILEVDLHGPFDGRKALKAIENHVLAQASAVGMYTPESSFDAKADRRLVYLTGQGRHANCCLAT
jgi:Raf kinase inhibitor-like YbhB/YbcL family protein